MGSLDGIVRPFQTPDIGPVPYPPSSANQSTQENTKIICGANGGTKTFSGNVSLSITYYQVKKPTEKKTT